MDQVPIGPGLLLLASGLLLGFFCGWYFARAGKPIVYTCDADLHNFTPRAQQVIALARTEADRFHHNFIGTEHLLLGLLELRKDSVAVIV